MGFAFSFSDWNARRLLRGGGSFSAILERPLSRSVSGQVIGLDAREWSSLSVLSFAVSFPIAFALILLYSNPAHALVFSLAASLSLALGVYAFPFAAASRKESELEGALSPFLVSLSSAYGRTGVMRAALAEAACSPGNPVSGRVREALLSYVAGSSAEEAFRELASGGSRRVSHAFSLISRSLESGVDVRQALDCLARESSLFAALERERRGRVSLVSWTISASSAFFFPLFAALGLVIMDVLRGISFANPYSAGERGLVEGAVFGYLVFGVFLDAGFNGRMMLGSFWRGVLAFAPPLCLVALAVFFAALKIGGAMAGV